MKRYKVAGGDATYHCMSRTVNGDLLFKSREKEILRKMLWQVADFSGVELLTYSIMGNHFHVLVRVPHVTRISDQELMRRYKVLYPNPTKYAAAAVRVMERDLAANGEEAAEIRERLMKRMHDVSMFMKTVKQRFSTWFNNTNSRFGPLWADRFKSVLVEGEAHCLQTMAAYIDLNSVRAGLVEDPKDYRFCGYAEAVAGNPKAKQGLAAVVGESSSLEVYRIVLYGKGAVPDGKGGAKLADSDAGNVQEKQGDLSPARVLRCRIRYLTDGAVLGTAEYVRGLAGDIQRHRYRKRAPAALVLEGPGLENLAVFRGSRRTLR